MDNVYLCQIRLYCCMQASGCPDGHVIAAIAFHVLYQVAVHHIKLMTSRVRTARQPYSTHGGGDAGRGEGGGGEGGGGEGGGFGLQEQLLKSQERTCLHCCSKVASMYMVVELFGMLAEHGKLMALHAAAATLACTCTVPEHLHDRSVAQDL